jgi:hypothetical protein
MHMNASRTAIVAVALPLTAIALYALPGVALAAASPSTPIPTPPIFVAGNYALTFRAPPDTTICALPADWVGSNHGTVLFLRPPKECGGVGYPSSSRSFSEDVPRIEVYYAYWLGDPGTGPERCRKVVGRIELVAKARKLCQTSEGPDLRMSVSARYTADAPAWVELTLVTTPERLRVDLKTFRQLSGSVTPCKVSVSRSDGKSATFGVGSACPAEGRFF